MLYQETVNVNNTAETFSILACIPNSGYYAVWTDENLNLYQSKFPFFLFAQTGSNRFFLPAIKEIVESPVFAFTNYIGYVDKPIDGITIVNDKSFNPFMPPELISQVNGMI